MNFILHFFYICINLDKYIEIVINLFGPYIYLILFFIIFCETGLVITPILPGESLIFIVGSLGSLGELNVIISLIIFLSAAILGDMVNY